MEHAESASTFTDAKNHDKFKLIVPTCDLVKF